MQIQGKSYVLETTAHEQVGTSRGKRTAATIGGGAAIGAAIGAIAGGGKGAGIGAAVGAGSGTVVQAVTKGKQVRIPSETKLDFRLEQPVEVTYLPEKNRSRRRTSARAREEPLGGAATCAPSYFVPLPLDFRFRPK